jgi:hypothetical protein
LALQRMSPRQQSFPSSLFPALVRGSLGFAGVSVAGFGVWAFGGRWLEGRIGEAGLFLTCTIVFIGLAGFLLHPLVRGPGSLVRFYKIFIPAFVAYAVAWSAAWFALRFGWGEWLGSLAGSVVFAAMIGRGLGNLRPLLKVSILMFAFHSAGYFIGEWCYMHGIGAGGGAGRGGHASVWPKLFWGLLFGLGVGAGLGYAFFAFQNEAAPPAKTPDGGDAALADRQIGPVVSCEPPSRRR